MKRLFADNQDQVVEGTRTPRSVLIRVILYNWNFLCVLRVSLRVLREPDDGTQGFTTNTKEDTKDTKKADMVLYP